MATLRRIALLSALALVLAAPACGQRALGRDAGPPPIGTLDAGGDAGAGLGGHGGGGVDTSAPGDAMVVPDAPADVPVSPPDAADAATDRATPDLGSDGAIDEAPRDVAADLPADATPDGICGSPTDPRNCGSCGHDCTALPEVRFDKVQCRDGACVIPADGCLPGWGHCSSDAQRGCDWDLTQRFRCGGCEVSCPTSAPLCTAATTGAPTCVASCAGTGLADCGGYQCVDLKTNNTHCGACNAVCNLPNAFATCVAGICTLSHCQAGYADCDPAVDGCETILGRFFDCGACGDSCGEAHGNGTCGASGCELHCHDGYGNCDPSNPDCEATLDTAANCGACGAACPNNRPLCGGARGAEACVAACAAPTPDGCGTSCTNLQSDPRHCGACGTACDGYQTCEAGRCTPRYVKTDVLSAPGGGATADGAVIGPDGSVYVSGTFSAATDFDPGAAQDVRTPVTSPDLFIVKLNADGSYAWTRTWAMSGVLGVGAVANDGSIFVSGHFAGTVDFDPGAGVTSITTNGVEEAVVLKLNAGGQLQWARAFTMTVEDAAGAEGGGLALGADGSLYATGAFRGQIDLDPGAGTNLHRTPSNDVLNGYVVKLTSAGTFAWGRAITSSADGWVGPIAVDPSGTLWLGGSFGGTIDLDPGAATDMHTASGYTDGFLARWDANGNYQAGQVYTGGAYDSVDAISFDADGSIYVAAESTDGGGGAYYVSTGLAQKLGADGALIWERRAPSMFRATAAPGGGVLYFGGGEDPRVEPTLVGKLDRDGKAVWSIPAPNPLSYFGASFAADATKLIIVGGINRGGADLDPGAATDLSAILGGAITRYAF